MKHGRKQWLALALTVLLGLGLLPTAALAEEPEGSISPVVEDEGRIGETEDVIPIIDSGQCGDSLNWRLTENGALVIFGSGNMWDYTVQNAPKWMSDYAKQITRIVVMEGVRSIGEKAFFTGPYQIRPEEILLPQSLKKIGNFAFTLSVYGNLTLPDGLQEIGEDAFEACRITGELRIPGTVQRIGSFAFLDCDELESLVLAEGVKEIGSQAFARCGSLKEVRIPASVTSIGYRAFGVGLDSLTDVYYGGSLADWKQIAADEAVMPSARVHCADGDIVPHTADHCGDDLIWSLDENGVLLISGSGDMWDYDVENPPWWEELAQIRELQILPGVSGIGTHAFSGCSDLERVSIPEGVTRIGQNAFSGCKALQKIDLPVSLRTIEECAFIGSGLVNVRIPEGVARLDRAAFYDCKNLKSVYVPGSIDCVGESAFTGCEALVSVSLGEGVCVLEEHTFFRCRSLKEVRFPSSVTEIGNWAFCHCTDLTRIHFDGQAPSVGQDAFLNDVATAWYPAEDPSWTEEIRQSYGDTISWAPYDAAISDSCGENLRWILEEDGTLSLFGTGAMWDSSPWQEYAERILRVNLPEGLTAIGNRAFSGCTALTGVRIPASLQQVGENAFSGCTAMERVDYGSSQEDWTDIRIGSGNEPLEEATLYYSASGTCGDAMTWELSEGILELRGRAEMWNFSAEARPGWYEARSIIDCIVIEEGIRMIGEYAFCNLAVKRVEMPWTVTHIGSYAFFGTKLTEIVFPQTAFYIGDYAFGNCSELRGVTVPNCYVRISPYVFSGCEALTDITVDEGNANYQSAAGVLFNKGATSLVLYPAGKTQSSYSIPAGVAGIAIGAFDGCRALESLTIPEGVTSIGSNAFRNCTGLVSVTIPASLETNGSLSFVQCEALTDLYYGDTVEAWQTLSIEYPPHRVTVHCTDGVFLSPVTGDLNGDGALNGLDLLQLRKYLVGVQPTADPMASDLNGDGTVTILDLVRLRKLLAGLEA